MLMNDSLDIIMYAQISKSSKILRIAQRLQDGNRAFFKRVIFKCLLESNLICKETYT